MFMKLTVERGNSDSNQIITQTLTCRSKCLEVEEHNSRKTYNQEALPRVWEGVLTGSLRILGV
jgi:hypothetical protein